MSDRLQRPRLWIRLVILGVSTVVLLEVVLQIGAVVVWLGLGRPAVEPADGRVILCVGDSCTHGIGSRDFTVGSYPARLEAFLRRNVAADWQVLNVGQAGQNSRDVLERLPAQLDRSHPAWVLVLVGQNDFWSRPERFVLEDGEVPMAPGAFRWRFRIGRLAAWLAGKWTGAGQAGAVVARSTPPPWKVGGTDWQPSEAGRAGRPRSDQPWAGDQETAAAMRDASAAEAAKRLGDALSILEAQLARRRDDPRVLAMLARLRRKTADAAGARDLLAMLRAGWDREQDAWWAVCWARALSDVADRIEARDRLAELVAALPDDAELIEHYARVLFLVDEVGAARVAIERAWQLQASSFLATIRYLVWRTDGGRPTTDALVEGYLFDNRADLLAGRIRALLLARPALRDVLAASIAAADCDEPRRARLTAIGDWVAEDLASEGSGEVSSTLMAHLEQIRAVVAAAGARAAFVTYPLRNSGVEELQAVAKLHDVPILPVHELFPSQDWQRLRAPDGHCNDDGYALMADMIGLWLAGRLGAGSPVPPVGLWRCEAAQVTLGLLPDGRGFLGSARLSWRTAEGALALSLDDGTELAFVASIDEERLTLQHPAGTDLDFASVR